MNGRPKKIVVVLGMHRSGTSAFTRGLCAMGVSLGDRLNPAVKGVNDKGFYEDLDIYTINAEMLQAIESDWHHLSPVNENDAQPLRTKGFFLRAVELMREKTAATEIFGLKDPSIVQFLPFWRDVFTYCELSVHYCIVIRNPRSVVQSLKKRNGFPAEKSYLLWLAHVIVSLNQSLGNSMIVVDYDLLMAAPETQLSRVAKQFDLTLDQDQLRIYKEDFLEEGLRHATFNTSDLSLDTACPRLAREIYTALLAIACDRVSVDDPVFVAKSGQWLHEYDRLQKILRSEDKSLKRLTTGKDAQISSLEQTATQHDQRILHLRQKWNNLLHSRFWRDSKPLRVLVNHVRELCSSIHALLLRGVMALCLLPAGFFYGGGLKNILRGKAFFRELLTDYLSVLRGIAGYGRMTRTLVKAPLSIALVLHETRSFRASVHHIREVLSGAPAFGWHTVPATSAASVGQEKFYQGYVQFITARATQENSPDFVPLTQERHNFQNLPVKLIAFYLPQFHAIPLNDAWFGKGFTEWTNVTKAIPQYTGHYQPQLPIDMGFYDLNDIRVMERQVELARIYGIHAFCFHYYWFSGTRLMEKPIFNWLQHRGMDFPFCLNWANENWSKHWDGGIREVGYKQELRDGDDEKFFADILPFFQDPRYIKLEGKPLFIIYRPHLFARKRCCRFAGIMRELAEKHGFNGLYMLSVNSHGFQEDPALWGLDAMLEFPPHGIIKKGLISKNPLGGFVNPSFGGSVWDGKGYVEKKKYMYSTSYKLFKGVFPSWDNTPRKTDSRASVFEGITPTIYKQWLADCIEYTNTHHSDNMKFVFINAWNEWAEGAHLEPDARYGYAYLQATRDALVERRSGVK